MLRPNLGWRWERHRYLFSYLGDPRGLLVPPRSFDADLWTVFQKNRRAMQMADPDGYKEMVDADVARWSTEHGVSLDEARRVVEAADLMSQPLWGWPPPAELGERIRQWHAPLASAQVALHGYFRADEHPPHGLVDMCRLTYVPERVRLLDTSRFPTSVQLLVAARTGGLQPSHREHLVEQGTQVDDAVVNDENLEALLEFGWTGKVDMASRKLIHIATEIFGQASPEPTEPVFANQFLGDTPLVQSRLGCCWLTRWRPGLDDEPIVVVCGNSAKDFSYAFTRQRLMGRTYWFPAGPSDQQDDFDHLLRQTFTAILSRHATTPDDNPSVLLTSLTLDQNQLAQLLGELRATPWGTRLDGEGAGALRVEVRDPVSLPVRHNLYLVDEVHYPKESFEPFLGNELARTLDIPLPSKAEGNRPGDCRWQIDVEDYRHVLPTRWLLHSILGSADSVPYYALRSSTSGISVDSHARGFVFEGGPLSQVLARVRIRFPSAREVFECLLADVGGRIEESDKGSFSRRMIDLWGGFTALASDLEVQPTRKLLLSWATKNDGVPGITAQGRRHLRLKDVMKLTGMRIDDARNLLDGYLHRNIVSRGLLFTCEECRGTSFYRLEDLDAGFRCQRCRQFNEILRSSWKGPREPTWFYALDEVVFQGLHSNTHVPLLALSRIAKPANSFLHMPEGKVIIDGRPDTEIDLWAIADGRIIIGEAKLGNRLESPAAVETKRCHAFAQLAQELTADQFVMASAVEWRQETRNQASQIIGSVVPIRLIERLDP